MLTIIQHTADQTLSDKMLQLLLLADPNKDAIKQYLPNSIILTASLTQRDNQELVGIAVLVAVDRPSGQNKSPSRKIIELKNIAIAPNSQGKGYAKQLINAAKQYALLDGATHLTIGTGNSSLSQLALYQKCGFRISHVVPDFFKNYPEPIFENGIRCLDMVMLSCDLTKESN